MKIDLVESGITFSKIGCGQCFEFEGIIYMRVESNHIEHDYGYDSTHYRRFSLIITYKDSTKILPNGRLPSVF